MNSEGSGATPKKTGLYILIVLLILSLLIVGFIAYTNHKKLNDLNKVMTQKELKNNEDRALLIDEITKIKAELKSLKDEPKNIKPDKKIEKVQTENTVSKNINSDENIDKSSEEVKIEDNDTVNSAAVVPVAKKKQKVVCSKKTVKPVKVEKGYAPAHQPQQRDQAYKNTYNKNEGKVITIYTGKAEERDKFGVIKSNVMIEDSGEGKVTLDDGSIFDVDPKDAEKSDSWINRDDISVTENDDKRYNVLIINRTRNETVRARYIGR